MATEQISTSWNTLIEKSESYSKLSKPENLAILDILKDHDELTIPEIHDLFTKNYHPNITQRQIRYILSTMEENNLINKNFEGYSINGLDVSPVKSPISMYEAILLSLSITSVVITWNIMAFGLFIGLLVCILLHQIEYALSQRKKPKIDKIIEKTISN